MRRKWKVVLDLHPNLQETPGRERARRFLAETTRKPPLFWRRKGAEWHAQRVSAGLVCGELDEPKEERMWVHLNWAVVPR